MFLHYLRILLVDVMYGLGVMLIVGFAYWLMFYFRIAFLKHYYRKQLDDIKCHFITMEKEERERNTEYEAVLKRMFQCKAKGDEKECDELYKMAQVMHDELTIIHSAMTKYCKDNKDLLDETTRHLDFYTKRYDEIYGKKGKDEENGK